MSILIKEFNLNQFLIVIYAFLVRLNNDLEYKIQIKNNMILLQISNFKNASPKLQCKFQKRFKFYQLKFKVNSDYTSCHSVLFGKVLKYLISKSLVKRILGVLNNFSFESISSSVFTITASVLMKLVSKLIRIKRNKLKNKEISVILDENARK